MTLIETVIAWVVENFFLHVIYPIAMEYATKRETDPVFKAASDAAYGGLAAAKTTDDRKAAARKLYELQKNS